MHLDFVWQQLAAAVDVGEDLLFELGHLLPEQAGRRRQVGVVALQRLHLVLQPGDALQLAHPTLGRSDPVPEPLPLGLQPLLRVNVDGGERRALPEALHVRYRLRLLFERLDPRLLRLRRWCSSQMVSRRRRRRRERDRVRGVVDGRLQRPAAVAVQVGVHRQVRLDGDRRDVGAQVQAAAARRSGSAQLILLVQVLQRLDEALSELLLVRHRLRVEELAAGRRRSHHAVRLDDEPLQVRRGQLEQPQVRGAEDALGVAQMRLEVRLIRRQTQVHVLLHHYFRGRSHRSCCWAPPQNDSLPITSQRINNKP